MSLLLSGGGDSHCVVPLDEEMKLCFTIMRTMVEL